MAVTCPHCGEAIDEGVTTCPHCGRVIASDTTGSAPPMVAMDPVRSVTPVPPVMPLQPPPQPPGAGGPAVAALVLGIIGVVLSFTIVFGFVLGALAIVFGAVAISRARTPGGGSKGMGIAGLVLGIVAILFASLVIALLVSIGGLMHDGTSNVQYCLDHPHRSSCPTPVFP